MRRAVVACGIFLTISVALRAETAPDQPVIPDGRVLLTDKCGRCHAVDATSPSPFKDAPPFRDVLKKFPVEELRMRLSEGVVSHFKDMPQVDFSDEEVTGIIDYLSTLFVTP